MHHRVSPHLGTLKLQEIDLGGVPLGRPLCALLIDAAPHVLSRLQAPGFPGRGGQDPRGQGARHSDQFRVPQELHPGGLDHVIHSIGSKSRAHRYGRDQRAKAIDEGLPGGRISSLNPGEERVIRRRLRSHRAFSLCHSAIFQQLLQGKPQVNDALAEQAVLARIEIVHLDASIAEGVLSLFLICIQG